MKGRVVNLDEHVRKHGRQDNPAPRRAGSGPAHEWTVSATVILKSELDVVPNVACAIWTVDIDAVRCAYEVSVAREGWRHSVIFQGKPDVDETREQTLHREGVILFLNELLSASYGVPA